MPASWATRSIRWPSRSESSHRRGDRAARGRPSSTGTAGLASSRPRRVEVAAAAASMQFAGAGQVTVELPVQTHAQPLVQTNALPLASTNAWTVAESERPSTHTSEPSNTKLDRAEAIKTVIAVALGVMAVTIGLAWLFFYEGDLGSPGARGASRGRPPLPALRASRTCMYVSAVLGTGGASRRA